MGATYTRQSTYSDGDTITAAHSNDEFNQLLAAFASGTGHTHDGTTAEGGPITKLLGTAITIGDGTTGTDIAVTFDGETNDGVLTWMEDEDHFKFSDDVVIDGTKRLYFNDEGGEYIHGDGTDLNLVSGADINIPANIGLTFGDDGEKIEGDGTDLTITGNNINLTATADVNIPSGVGLTFATAEKIESDGTDLTITVGSNGDINIPANIGLTFGDDGEKIEGDGTDLTITGNNINLTATADVVIPADVGITFGSGEKIEGDNTDLTITSGAKINLTATSDVHIPNNVGIVFGGDSEKIEGDGTDLTISANNLTVDAVADIILDAGGADVILKDGGTQYGTLTNSSGNLIVKSGSTTMLTGSGANATFAGTITTTGLITGGSLDIDDVVVNGSTIGHTDDTDLITVADGIVTVAGEISVTTLDIGGTNVTATGAELNLMDGGATVGTTAVADGDGIVTNDGGTMRQTTVQTFATYFGSEITEMSNLVTTGALNSGSITSGFGAIDNGSSAITTTGTITGGALTVDDVGVNGKVITMTGSTSDTATFTVGTNGTLDIVTTDDNAAAANIQITADGTAELAGTTVTLDSGGDKILDANGANVTFKDDGTSILDIANNSTDVELTVSTADKNFKIKGTDGSSAITALDIDMALVGKATFSGDVVVTGDLTITGDDLFMNTNTSGHMLVGDGTNYNPVAISGDISIASNGAVTIANTAVENAMLADNAVDTDEIADNAVTLAKMAGLARGKIIVGDSSGDPSALALGSNGQVLQSDGSDLVFGSVSAGSLAADDLTAGDGAVNLTTTSGNITIDAQDGDSDIIFKGTDGSSDTTFLTLDGSDAGTAIFNHDVQLKSDASILSFGADNEITLTHDADIGLILKNANTGDDKPVILALHTGETDIAANDVLGAIEFKAPDEGTGTDAIAKAAHIQAVSEGDFSATSNATRIEFGTGLSESATTKMSLTSGGNLVIGSTTSSAGRLEIAGSNGTIGGVAGIAKFLTGASAGGAIEIGDDTATIQCGSDGTDAFISTATDIRFLCGAGERMRVESTGHVGIGVADPANSGLFGGTQVSLNVMGSTAPEVRIKSSVGDCDTSLVASNSSSNFFIVNGANGVALSHDGTSFGSASDENLKTIIEDIESAETKINSLRAVIGRYKEVLYTKDILYDDDDVDIPDGKKIGDVKVAKGSVKQKADADTKRRSFLIAQDVQKVLPEAVTEVVGQDNETYLNMSYTDVIPLLVAGIKELSAKCADYEKRIKALESA